MLEKLSDTCYRVPKLEPMRVEAYIYLNDALLPFLEYEAVKQLKDAAGLPGAYGRVIGMPDIHTGFGLPIGGVLATRKEDGVISAGAVGMDINCGVRLLTIGIPKTALDRRHLGALIREIEQRVPVGVGKKSRHTRLDVAEVLTKGAPWLIEQGYGTKDDALCCEENGCLAGANPDKLSKKAIGRADQLSTLGGGNHFIEIVYIAEVFDLARAKSYGIEQDQIAVLIHTGSRGLGHQICTDYTEILFRAGKRYGIEIPGKGLAAAPIDSQEGQDYYAAMACATNFAFANRQLITHDVRQAFAQVLGTDYVSDRSMKLIYDVCHNIAKFEYHDSKQLLVHRKGAVRALPAGHAQLTERFRAWGNPVLVPGSMGNSSYVVVGTDLARDTFYSVNHGAGRTLSRTAAKNSISPEELRKSIGDTLVNVERLSRILDEAPAAYKDISQVVDTLVQAGITEKVAELRPLAVIKGEE